MASSVKSEDSDVVNIPIENIIHDTPMMNWSKKNAPSILNQVQPKKLPPKKDTVGTLKPKKIDRIQSAYDAGIQHKLPPINVKQYGKTGFYEVIDGRHRSVMALKHGEKSIPAKIMTGGKKRRSYPKRYIPTALSKRDKRKQRKMITKSRRVKRNIKNKVRRKSVRRKSVRRRGVKRRSVRRRGGVKRRHVRRKMKGGAIPPCEGQPKSINDIWNSMHSDNFEICGCAILDPNTNKYQLFQNGQGPGKPPAERRFCQTLRNYGIVWHTHPACCETPSKLYPSVEDLLKVVKHGSHTSLIFCQYGVWTISCAQKIVQQQIINMIQAAIAPIVDHTVNNTHNGQDLTNETLNWLIDNIFAGLKKQGLEIYIPSYKIAFNFWDHYEEVLNLEISDRYRAINPNDHFY